MEAKIEILERAAAHLSSARREVEAALTEIAKGELLIALTEITEATDLNALKLNGLTYGLIREALEKEVVTLKANRARLLSMEVEKDSEARDNQEGPEA